MSRRAAPLPTLSEREARAVLSRLNVSQPTEPPNGRPGSPMSVLAWRSLRRAAATSPLHAPPSRRAILSPS